MCLCQFLKVPRDNCDDTDRGRCQTLPAFLTDIDKASPDTSTSSYCTTVGFPQQNPNWHPARMKSTERVFVCEKGYFLWRVVSGSSVHVGIVQW